MAKKPEQKIDQNTEPRTEESSENSNGQEVVQIDDTDGFLLEVGDIVRNLRARRGITRKTLAQNSGISERYLANLELGKGNISINLLRRVSIALRSDLQVLLPSDSKKTPEQALINEFIGRLTRDKQQEALEILYQKFTSLENAKKRIVLVGLRGAGKSTLGRMLEEKHGLPFVKVTDIIEEISGMGVSEILALSGQSGYRRLEEKALYSTMNEYESCCIETSGGIVSEAKGLNFLLTTCLVVWVKASPEEHMSRVIAQGDLRPMANNEDAMDDLCRILKERTPYYEKAHLTLDTSGKTIDQSYTMLLKLVQENFSKRNDPEVSFFDQP